jgi:hypothetical protein
MTRCRRAPRASSIAGARRIVVADRLEPNGQVAVLVHERAHVHGARYRDFGRAGAEVVAETAAFIILSAARLDAAGQSVPYVAGWADAAPKEMVAYAEAVHRIAAKLEEGLGLSIEARAFPPRTARGAPSRGQNGRAARLPTAGRSCGERPRAPERSASVRLWTRAL